MLVRGHEDETIGDFLLSIFLRQLPKNEQHELIICAVPRILDAAILRAVLRLASDIEARERFYRYRRLTFVRAIDDERIAFHPIVRKLLLRRLIPDYNHESDYYQTHTHLRDHFRKYSRYGNGGARIEEAYHALAVGDPKQAIEFAISTLNKNPLMFQMLLEAVKQAPTKLMPFDTKERASKALQKAMLHHDIRDHVTALVLFSWLSSAPTEGADVIIDKQRNVAKGRKRGVRS